MPPAPPQPPSRLRVWLTALRLVAAPASLAPVALGGLLPRALGEPFAWLPWGLALLAALLLHTAANLWNDYFDFRDGLDTPDGATGSGVLTSRALTPAQVARAAALCSLLAAALGLYLCWRVRSWQLLLLGVLGLLAAPAYSMGRHSPKRLALGELWVFLWMGPAMTEGAWLVQAARFSWPALILGLPSGLFAALLMLFANIRDLQPDRAVGLRTLPARIFDRFRSARAPALCLTFLVALILLLVAAAPFLLLPYLPPGRSPRLLLTLLFPLLTGPLGRFYASLRTSDPIPFIAFLQLLHALLLLPTLLP